MSAADPVALGRLFASDGELVINGNAEQVIPLAGTHRGRSRIIEALTAYFGLFDIVSVAHHYHLTDQHGEASIVRGAFFFNLTARARTTGTVVDFEHAVVVILGPNGRISTARWFFNTDIHRRALAGTYNRPLIDEKGTSDYTLLDEPPALPSEIVTKIYEVMFEGVPAGTKLGVRPIMRTAVGFLRHNLKQPPKFWWRLIRRFSPVALVRQSTLMQSFYDPALVHMIKGGESDVGLCGTYHGLDGLSDFALRLLSEVEYDGVPPQLLTLVEGNRCLVHMPETFVNNTTGTRAVVHMLHMWRFSPEGRVVEFKSYNDTYEIIRAYDLADGPIASEGRIQTLPGSVVIRH